LIRSASMRALLGLWRPTWIKTFTVQAYDRREYQRVHALHHKTLTIDLRRSVHYEPWGVLEHGSEARRCAELIGSRTELQLFVTGVFKYKGELFHGGLKFGEWMLQTLSFFPWSRCMFTHVVSSPKNVGLGGTPLNIAQDDLLAALAEMPRVPKRSLDYMLTCAWATATTDIAHLDGFDNHLMQTGTHTTSVSLYASADTHRICSIS
jgi:hypothetical protein